MILFIALSIVDIRFGFLGFACIGAPIYHAIRGRGKIHCSKYCPRGSLLGRFLQEISFQNNLPKKIKTKTVKNSLLALMVVMFAISMYHGLNAPNAIKAIGFGVFRLMMSSLVVGIVMGVIYKPRSWCQVCPMGHGTALINESQNNKKTVSKNVIGSLKKAA